MDWINCNRCCRQPGDEKDRTFILTSCGHLFCDLCLAQAKSRDKCSVCSAQCQLIKLSSKMEPDAEMFFQEPSELLKKQQTQMNRLLDFQKQHRIRLVSFHRKMLVKYKELEKRFKQAGEKIQQLEKENVKLKELINSGVKGGGEYGCVGPNISPHASYQRAITASALRNSPQGGVIQHISPNGSRISPGRLSLLKAKTASANRISPTLPNQAKAMQQMGRSGSFAQMKGYSHPLSPTSNSGSSIFATPDSSRMQSPISGNYGNGISFGGPTGIQMPPSSIAPFMPYSQSGSRVSQPHQAQANYGYAVRTSPSLVPAQEVLGPSRSYNVNRNAQVMPVSYHRY